MTKTTLKYILSLTVLLVLSVIVMISVFEVSWSELAINYVFNYSLSVATFCTILYFLKKKSDQLGFIYLGNISLRFLLFFIFLYPAILADGEASKREFAFFFIPFTLCLFTEVLYVLRALKEADKI